MCQRRRKPTRDDAEKRLRVWMVINNYDNKDIQTELEIKHHGHITGWLQGKDSNARIADWFIRKGCPKELVMARIKQRQAMGR